MPRWWKRVRPWVERIRGLFPLSMTGLLVLGLSAAAVRWGGMGRADLVLLAAGVVVGVLSLALLLVSIAAALLLARRMKSAPPPGPLALETFVPQPTAFNVPFPTWIPCLSIDWSWEDDFAPRVDTWLERRGGRLNETVRPLRRGQLDGVTRKVTVGDVLGVSSITWRVRDPAPVSIAPWRGMMDSVEIWTRMTSGDGESHPSGEPVGDYIEMRRYSPGDSPKLLLWKVYARTRKLLVRVPERAVTPQPRTCAYLVAGPHDEPAAGLARVVLERGLLGVDWRFGADGCEGSASALKDAMDFVLASGNADESGAGLAVFLSAAEREGYPSCLLLLPPLDGPALDRVIAALGPRPMRMTAVLALDVMPAQRTLSPRWHRYAFRPPDDGSCTIDELSRQVSRLHAAGIEPLIADRSTGRVFADVQPLLQVVAGRSRP